MAVGNNRENLAQRHPCYSINKLLIPYIKWTEKLASTQRKVQTDACGQTKSGPACCTNEIFNSYAFSLGNDIKILSDSKLDQLANALSLANKRIDNRIKEYIKEFRPITISSLETLFGTEEYHSNLNHALLTLFNTLGDHRLNDNDVSKSAVDLFSHLIVSSYRRFMIDNDSSIFDNDFKKCLTNAAFAIPAFPTQRELLYTLTSATSLIKILQTLFIYIDADIQRLKTTVTIHSQQCLQRYVRETLCPICVSASSSSSSSSSSLINYDSNANDPLCEKDCHYVIKTCFNETDNPYIAFALLAQSYSDVIKQIQKHVIELKIVERLSKLHIYLYDMVVNATNTRNTYLNLQKACPNPNEKPFRPIVSLSPIISERHEHVKRWNTSLHYMLDRLQSLIANLNTSLTQPVASDICSNTHYAVNSSRCIQIDQNTPGDFLQWPLPPLDSNSQSTLTLTVQSTHNQLDELKKKLLPIEQIIISLRPKPKISYYNMLPDFHHDYEVDLNDNDIQSSSLSETYDIDHQEPLSEKLYKEIDGQTTHRSPIETTDYFEEENNNNNNNHSQLMTYNITSYLFVFLVLFIHRILFTHQ